MNLRTRAAALSILPLALTLLLAVPEGILQWQVIQLASQSEKAAQAASAARDVTDALSKWKFTPASQDGQPFSVPSTMDVVRGN